MKSRVRPLGAAIVVAFLVTLFAPAGAQAAEGPRAKAERILIAKGMQAEVASKIANDPKAKITVKSNEVYVDGTSMTTIMSTAARAAQMSVIVDSAKGSDWWYGTAWNSQAQLKTVIYLRYSWSWMWYLKNNMGTISTYSQLACGLISKAGATAVTACIIIIKAYLDLSKRKINEGISNKLCLRWRMPAPPLVDYSLLQWSLVKCRV